jgi:hypothetical protein
MGGPASSHTDGKNKMSDHKIEVGSKVCLPMDVLRIEGNRALCSYVDQLKQTERWFELKNLKQYEDDDSPSAYEDPTVLV